MKNYKTKCECMACVGELTLSKKKTERRVTILVNRAPVEFGLYKLLRIKDWLGRAITEIEKLK